MDAVTTHVRKVDKLMDGPRRRLLGVARRHAAPRPRGAWFSFLRAFALHIGFRADESVTKDEMRSSTVDHLRETVSSPKRHGKELCDCCKKGYLRRVGKAAYQLTGAGSVLARSFE